MNINYITPDIEHIRDGMYNFFTSVNTQKTENYTINIYTSGRYILTINGKYICEGPCKSHEYVRYYDTVEAILTEGINKINIKVMHIGEPKKFSTVFKTLKPQAIFEATSSSNRIATDETWKCNYDNSCLFRYSRWKCLPPFEDIYFDYEKDEIPLTLCGKFDFEKGPQTFCGIASGIQPEKRPIPMIFPGDDIRFAVVKKGRDFIELDAGMYSTAKLSFCFAKNTDARIIYAECYRHKEGKGVRDDSSGFIDGYYDTVHTGDEDAAFSPFWFRSFRFIRIEADNIEDSLISYGGKKWHYPIDSMSYFECSDESFNKMNQVSINTMLCCSHDSFYDCPYYEQRQYEMDAAIEASVFLRMTNDTRLVKKCIEEFASSQLDSGLLLSIYPSVIKQIIPGYSFFWIFMLRDYLDYTADTEFAKRFVGNIDKIITYFNLSLSSKGLVTRSKYWDFVDWVKEWDNGEPVVEEGKEITVYTMYFAYALLCAEYICEKTGRKGLACEYRHMYDNVCTSIKKYCYNEEKGLYKDSPECNNYSAHTIVWSVIAELEKGENAKSIMSHINDADISKTSFAMNFYLFRAYEKNSMTEEIFKCMDGWKHMLNMNCTSWCEDPGISARSECHGWSSAPLYEFSSNILGVKLSFEDEIIIKPVTDGLTFAKGCVPTRFGDVYVSWKKENGVFKITVEAPSGARKKLIMPDGKILLFESSQTTMEYIDKM